MNAPRKPFVVALGGTLRDGSSTEMALRIALDAAGEAGCETLLLGGKALDLPPYAPGDDEGAEAARPLIEAVRRADGLIFGTPGYHGSMSGLVKNAIDYIEELRGDARPYLDGRAVGSLATGGGWQGAIGALTALRGVIHALRGWNTPLGVPVNTAEPIFDDRGACMDDQVAGQLRLMGRQVAGFAVRAGLAPVA